jgi:hypothetical protein
MTTGFDEFDDRIRELAQRQKECDGLFDEIKKGNGDQSFRYLALRDSCNELRKEIIRSAISAGLTRERIKMEMTKARNQRSAVPKEK